MTPVGTPTDSWVPVSREETPAADRPSADAHITAGRTRRALAAAAPTGRLTPRRRVADRAVGRGRSSACVHGRAACGKGSGKMGRAMDTDRREVVVGLLGGLQRTGQRGPVPLGLPVAQHATARPSRVGAGRL